MVEKKAVGRESFPFLPAARKEADCLEGRKGSVDFPDREAAYRGEVLKAPGRLAPKAKEGDVETEGLAPDDREVEVEKQVEVRLEVGIEAYREKVAGV